MDRKSEQPAMIAGNSVFLLSEYELTACKPSESYTPWWWWKSPVHTPPPVPSIQNPVVMEGSSWHKTAAERGAILRPKMRPGKVYLYQMHTTCFAEFETVEQAKKFCQYADQNIQEWNVDPVIIIDTTDLEAVKHWGNFMEG